MTPEKIVQNKIVDYLNKLANDGLPVFVERRNAGGFSYKTGIPDLYASINSIHVEIEVKRPGGELSIMQQKYRDKCFKRRMIWACFDNIDDCIILVNKLLSINIPKLF